MKGPRQLARIFVIPTVLFGISLFGLVAALLVQGPVDNIFAIAAGAGVVAASVVLATRH